MANGINHCTFIGNLGRDPEENRNDNNSRTTFSIAVSESWNDKNTGEKKEKTEWVNFVAFGKVAEIIGQYAKKGTKMYIESKVQTRKFQNSAGEDKYYTEFMVKNFLFLGGSEANEKPAQSEGASQQQNEGNYKQGTVPDGFDDDIPF